MMVNSCSTLFQYRRFRFAGVILLFVVSIFSEAAAQEVSSSGSVKHALGYSGGYVQGSGLTYMRYFGSHIVQATFNPDVSGNNKDMQAGLSYARYLHQIHQPRSMLPVGLKLVAGFDVRYQDGYIDSDIIAFQDQIVNRENDVYFFHSGAGLAIDIGNPTQPGLVLSLILSYALSLEELNRDKQWEISPLPGISFFYNW